MHYFSKDEGVQFKNREGIFERLFFGSACRKREHPYKDCLGILRCLDQDIKPDGGRLTNYFIKDDPIFRNGDLSYTYSRLLGSNLRKCDAISLTSANLKVFFASWKFSLLTILLLLFLTVVHFFICFSLW